MEFILPKNLQKYTTVAICTPSDEKPDLLSFAETTTIQGSFGEIHQQHAEATTYTIYRHIFRMAQPIRLQVVIHEPMITLSYALQGELSFVLNGAGKTQIQSGLYHLYYIPAGTYLADIPAGETVIFQVNLQTEHIEGADDEPVQQVLNNVLQNSRRGLQQNAAAITPKVKAVLESIHACKLDDAKRDIFLRARIYDLLLLYLDTLSDAQKLVTTKFHFSPDDLQSLQEVSDKLVNNLHQQIPLEEVAKQVHLHPRKLTEGFRLYFGVSMHEWLLQARMERAKCLLSQQTNIRDVAYEVGYDTVSGFIRAFKSFTGSTPANYNK
ncbi:helix-turn-helix transcriptional regulator [Chitinophaga sp. G-6-1-13]|uniref:Helix-turn-helix transcriptional regulator n=1 Tax=Chitinophaga fulva TaxID=2728842 RepID=A0A848GUM7_9BACT|nr:AraC family transcriptional regulator [Chitinophaga fulva]NML40423.1 helix-turn-helix transcriptional regulator [Chitinophaga fulva]